MNPKARARSALERIRADHRAILELTATVAAAKDPPGMATHLARLEPLLKRHFREEEDFDGLHAAIRQRTPEQEAVLHRLVAEHAELLELVHRMQALATGSATAGELHLLGQRLQRRLQAHEAHESTSYMDSIWNDLGEGD